MALSFPSSPSVGDYYAPGTRVWRWNGTFWEVVTPVQFAKVGNFVETITPTPEGHARLLEGPAVALLVACLLCLSAVSSWAQATVSKVVVDVKMSDGKFQARELTPVMDNVIGFDGSGNLVVKAGGSGSGSVTSVAISGTDGIEVDSGSPITSAGTIQLGVNAATMKTTLDLTGANSGDVTIADTDTIDLGLTGQALTASARTQMSITSDASGLKLSGDAASPGNSKYYGTNSGGTKGYYDLPSGGGGGATSIWIDAAEWIPRTTNGAGVDSGETATNDNNFDYLTFDAGATNEGAQKTLTLPNNYAGGTVTARFYWTAASGSGTVIWKISGRALSDDDALDTATGTAQSVTDTLITAEDMHVSSATSAVTIAGSPAANVPIIFTITRDSGTDTLAVDAKLIGVQITW